MPTAIRRVLIVLLTALTLVGCASTGIEPAPHNDEAPELTIGQAIELINNFRASTGVAPLVEDSALDTYAVQVASTIALVGKLSSVEGVRQARYAAGVERVEQALAIWRNDPVGATAMLDPLATKAGIGAVVYSGKGAHWVLLLN
jgi:uncharacterized protein YkwD